MFECRHCHRQGRRPYRSCRPAPVAVRTGPVRPPDRPRRRAGAASCDWGQAAERPARHGGRGRAAARRPAARPGRSDARRHRNPRDESATRTARSTVIGAAVTWRPVGSAWPARRSRAAASRSGRCAVRHRGELPSPDKPPSRMRPRRPRRPDWPPRGAAAIDPRRPPTPRSRLDRGAVGPADRPTGGQRCCRSVRSPGTSRRCANGPSARRPQRRRCRGGRRPTTRPRPAPSPPTGDARSRPIAPSRRTTPRTALDNAWRNCVSVQASPSPPTRTATNKRWNWARRTTSTCVDAAGSSAVGEPTRSVGNGTITPPLASSASGSPISTTAANPCRSTIAPTCTPETSTEHHGRVRRDEREETGRTVRVPAPDRVPQRCPEPRHKCATAPLWQRQRGEHDADRAERQARPEPSRPAEVRPPRPDR